MKSKFVRMLEERGTDPTGRRWLFVPYDQLTDAVGPLSREDPGELGVVLVESPWKASRRPYHKQKLALVLANLRHFALEQAERGVAVRHVVASKPHYRSALEPICRTSGPLRVMEPAERELRADLAALVEDERLRVVEHEGWLTTADQFRRSQTGPPWRMDVFYRLVRRESGVLMEGGKPAGGKFSFDVENRRAWKGEPPAPAVPRFPIDAIKEEVVELVERKFARHPGRLDPDALPATRGDARKLWSWARRRCLPHFGPFEDAMSTRSSNLFHTRVSALLNLHRILPRRVVADVAKLDVPLASKEGFIRQVLGWREFVRHVHVATDGFRRLPRGRVSRRRRPGDGGWGRWSGEAWHAAGGGSPSDSDGGASPSFLGSSERIPSAYWGEESGLACLDRVIRDVWSEGYGHHITRLMILSNLATLLDLSPRDLTDWFWVAYADAYDWVVEPNVLGMGTFATGDLMTTKPYVSGSAYIRKMSDYCSGCAFDPRKNCPITPMYWAFLDRHRPALKTNPRLRMPMRSLAKRAAARRRHDASVFEKVRDRLRRGRRIAPENLPDA